MIRSKTAAALTALCALCFLALSASSASAAFTTAGECTNAAGNTKDFIDEHCDKPIFAGGSFGHILFTNGALTEVTATNDLTGTAANVTLEGTIGGVVVNVRCTTATAIGFVTNNAGGSVSFGNAMTAFFGCAVEEKPAICKGTAVTVPEALSTPTGLHTIKISMAKTKGPTGELVTFHEPEGGTEMGLKFVPIPVGGNFTTLTFNKACNFGEAAIPVKGSAIATPGRGGAANSSGATAIFSKSSTVKTLTVGGGAGTPAYLEATFTFRKRGGNPLILTTKE
jgi:hypothetical protein